MSVCGDAVECMGEVGVCTGHDSQRSGEDQGDCWEDKSKCRQELFKVTLAREMEGGVPYSGKIWRGF